MRAWLGSILLIAGMAKAQSAAPPRCNGQPLTVEAQAASIPAECNGVAPACERIPKSANDIIFTGTVTKLTESPASMLLEGACTETTVQTVTLQVKESFSGSLPRTITVRAGYINGHWFRPKETALVFARKLPDGVIFVSGCRTEPIGDWFPSAKEDLAYLRSRDKLSPTGSLFGYTWVIPPRSMNDKAIAVSFGGQSLTITGPVSKSITTSKNGEFRLENLPAGTYTLHLDSSLPAYPGLDQQAEVFPKGCAEINFYIESATDYNRITSSMLKARAKK
jgi:hypothetical protein